jgi:hypothetical protein
VPRSAGEADSPVGAVVAVGAAVLVKFQPVKRAPEIWEGARFDVVRAALEAFGTAAAGGAPFPITLDEMVHGAAVTEAVIRSAESGSVEKI